MAKFLMTVVIVVAVLTGLTVSSVQAAGLLRGCNTTMQVGQASDSCRVVYDRCALDSNGDIDCIAHGYCTSQPTMVVKGEVKTTAATGQTVASFHQYDGTVDMPGRAYERLITVSGNTPLYMPGATSMGKAFEFTLTGGLFGVPTMVATMD